MPRTSTAMSRHRWGRTGVGLGAVLLMSASAAVVVPEARAATTASEVRSPSLRFAPTDPAPTDTVKFSGTRKRLAQRVIRLEVKRVGTRNAKWTLVTKKRATRTGRFSISRAVRHDARYRVVAPAAGRAGRWVSKTVRVTPRKRVTSVVLGGSGTKEQGGDHSISATIRPAQKGRRVSVQVREGDRWREVHQFTTTKQATARVPVLGLGTGRHTLRVVAAPTARARGAAATRPLTVQASTTHGRTTLRDVAQGQHLRGALPVVRITTPSSISSKETYVRTTMSVEGSRTRTASGTPLPSHTVSARLRVRGNSTSWVKAKLPYKVKLDDDTSLLGMPKSKDFVLLANFYDRSLMRNTAAFEAARRIGVPWAPRMVDVDLYLNGVYKGVYQLGEGIEVEPGRVDLGADDLPETPGNGGYLIEADHWDDTDPRFRTARGIQFYLKETGADDAAYVAALRDEIQAFEDVLYSDDFLDDERGYRRLVDLRSFADWYLTHELTKSTEANFSTSVWVQRAVGGRLAMGPPWDFDQSAGARNTYGLHDPEGWFVHAGPLKPGVHRSVGMVRQGPHWIQRMLQDPEFRALVQQRWRVASPGLRAMVTQLDAHSDRIAGSADRNFAPLPRGAQLHLGRSTLDAEDVVLHHTSWRAHADSVVGWYGRRIAWLDRAMPTLGSDRLP